MNHLSRVAASLALLSLVGAVACGGGDSDDPSPAGAAGTSAGGSAGTSAGGSAGTSAGGSAGTSAGGTAGTSAGGSAGTSAGGGAGTSAGGTAGTSAGGAAGTSAGGSAGASAGGSAGAAPTTTMSTGAFNGTPLAVIDGAANERIEVKTSTGKPDEHTRYLTVTLASVANACTYYKAGDKPANTQFLSLGLISIQKDGTDPPPFALTTYKVGANLSFMPFVIGAGAVGTLDATCTQMSETFDGVNAGSGTITLAQNDGKTVAGSFDVTDKKGQKFTGTFSVPYCDVPTPAPMGTCK